MRMYVEIHIPLGVRCVGNMYVLVCTYLVVVTLNLCENNIGSEYSSNPFLFLNNATLLTALKLL